jgi:hypothetical protein
VDVIVLDREMDDAKTFGIDAGSAPDRQREGGEEVLAAQGTKGRAQRDVDGMCRTMFGAGMVARARPGTGFATSSPAGAAPPIRKGQGELLGSQGTSAHELE